MRKLGMPEAFIHLVSMLLHDASASVMLNGKTTEQFPIHRGVWQRCPLVPYLFLLIGEVLNMAVSKEQQTGQIQGIELSNSTLQQLLSQFADDTGLSIRGAEEYLRHTILLLKQFGSASGLLINWQKSVGYWFSALPRPAWLDNFDLTWAPPGSLSKLLGAPFGITLETTDVDRFLKDKISKKLRYWSSQRLSLAGSVTVVNAVLFSTLYYFIAIWSSSLQVIRSIRVSLRNFLWSGSEHSTRG